MKTKTTHPAEDAFKKWIASGICKESEESSYFPKTPQFKNRLRASLEIAFLNGWSLSSKNKLEKQTAK